MCRLARGILWLIKGMLLVVALAVLLLWPLSYRRGGTVILWRSVAAPGQVNTFKHRLSWFGGRLAIVWMREHRAHTDEGPFRNEMNNLFDWAAEGATRLGPGWRCQRLSWAIGDWSWLPDKLYGPWSYWGPAPWGRLHWKSYHYQTPGYADDAWGVAAPCWMVALPAGAWPICSLALLAHRTRRRRRWMRTGCCSACGYDLRATPAPPSAGGTLLAQCPECGRATDAAVACNDGRAALAAARLFGEDRIP
jgi:hypothetical protein